MAEKGPYAMGNGILNTTEHGTLSEIYIDTKFFDDAAKCFLFRQCDIGGACKYLDEDTIKELEKNIPDIDGKINGQLISSGGIKAWIETVVRLFIKIFGFLVEQIVVFIKSLFDINYTFIVKMPLDIAATIYMSTPVTINPPGIVFANGIKFKKDLKKQKDTIAKLKKMIEDFKKILTNLTGFISDKISDLLKDVRIGMPPISIPFLPGGNKEVFKGNDFYKAIQGQKVSGDPELEEVSDKVRNKKSDFVPVNIFDVSNVKIGNQVVDLDLASLLLNPIKELKKYMPGLEEPNLSGITTPSFMNDPETEYFDQFEEYVITGVTSTSTGITVLSDLHIHNKLNLIKRLKNSNYKMCDIRYTDSGLIKTKPFSYYNDIITMNLPDEYTGKTFTGEIDKEGKMVPDAKENARLFLVDTMKLSKLLTNGNYEKKLIKWIDDNQTKIVKEYEIPNKPKVESKLLKYIKDAKDSHDAKRAVYPYNNPPGSNVDYWKNYTENNITLETLYKYSLDLLDKNFYISEADFDDIAHKFMMNIDDEDTTQTYRFESVIKLHTDIFSHMSNCKLMPGESEMVSGSPLPDQTATWNGDSQFLDFIKYPRNIKEFPDVNTIDLPKTADISKIEDFIPGNISAIIKLVEFIKQMIMVPINFILDQVKKFMKIIKKLITLNVPGAIKSLTDLLKGLLPVLGTIKTNLMKIANTLGLEMGTTAVFKDLDILTICLPNLIFQIMRILIHKLFDTVKKMLKASLDNDWVPSLTTYMGVTTFPGTQAFITAVTAAVTAMITAIDALITAGTAASDIKDASENKVFSLMIIK